MIPEREGAAQEAVERAGEVWQHTASIAAVATDTPLTDSAWKPCRNMLENAYATSAALERKLAEVKSELKRELAAANSRIAELEALLPK